MPHCTSRIAGTAGIHNAKGPNDRRLASPASEIEIILLMAGEKKIGAEALLALAMKEPPKKPMRGL